MEGHAVTTPSGINDAMIGGFTNTAADRDAARLIAARYPAVPEMARAGHAFILRTVRWAALELGIRRFIRPGYVTRLPGLNAHDAVRDIAPDARVVYVTRGDQAAMAMAILGARHGITVARARVAFADQVLAAEPVAAMLAEGKPVCMVTGMFYHHAPAPHARNHMRAYAAALPPGSVLAASLIAVTDEEAVAELGDLFGTPFHPHTAAGAAGWLDSGMEVVPLTPEITEPGTALGVVAQIM